MIGACAYSGPIRSTQGGIREMRSLADRYTDNIERSKRIDRGTPQSEIDEIRKEIEILDYELRHTTLEPSQRRELLKLSGEATAVLARQIGAARHPLVIDPAPRTHDSSPTRSAVSRPMNAFAEHTLRERDYRRDYGMER
ncbi:hypothetical protein [Nocardia sp. NPDC050406]|uniref:hypothetical protein n=1 Tax=Nocardia sp. NPDC050406 TaxID=3364318 RepID=UPI003792ADB1